MPLKLTTVATSASPEYSGGFSFPHIGGTRVIFSAYSGADDQVMASFVGSTVKDLVNAGTPTDRFLGIAQPSSTATATAFVGQMKNEESAIFVHRGQQIAMVAAGSKGITSMSGPSLASDGSVAFIGMRAGVTGLFLAGAHSTTSSSVHQLINSTRHPTHGSAPLTCIENPALSADGAVAFFGSSCDGRSTSLLRDSDRFRRSRRASSHAIRDDSPPRNKAAGIFLVRQPAVGHPWPEPGAAHIEVIADYSTGVPTDHGPAPASTPPAQFVGFSSPVASKTCVAFIGQSSSGTLGIYSYSLATGGLALIADTTTPVPHLGARGGSFSDFPYVPSVSPDCAVAFFATAGGAASGIYLAESPKQHAQQASARPAPPTIRPLLTMADKIAGEPIAFLGLGAGAFDGQTAALYAVTSTVDGIYALDTRSSAITSLNHSFPMPDDEEI